MSPRGPGSIEIELPSTEDSARRARKALDAFEDELPVDVLDNLRLLVSELVTNSLRHARVRDGDRITLRASVTSSLVRVEVVDQGPGFHPSVDRAPTMYQTSGWGLYFVAELADRWGVFSDRGTHAWFELDRSTATPSMRTARPA